MFEGVPSGAPVQTSAPRVTLRNSFAHPFDSAIAAARTCYADHLITPEEITDKQRLNIGAATFNSGHHTVFQHATFRIRPRKRQPPIRLVFSPRPSLLQFRTAKPALRPHGPRPGLRSASRYIFQRSQCKEIYEQAIVKAWDYYRQLSTLLIADARAILADIWHVGPNSSPKHIQKIERAAEKRAIEIARYVLPVAAFTTMVHTISGIVLHRLWRMSAASDTPSESRAVVKDMVEEVKKIDPQFFERFGTEPLEERPEWSADATNTKPAKPSPKNSMPSSREKLPSSSTIPPTPQPSWPKPTAP